MLLYCTLGGRQILANSACCRCCTSLQIYFPCSNQLLQPLPGNCNICAEQKILIKNKTSQSKLKVFSLYVQNDPFSTNQSIIYKILAQLNQILLVFSSTKQYFMVFNKTE